MITAKELAVVRERKDVMAQALAIKTAYQGSDLTAVIALLLEHFVILDDKTYRGTNDKERWILNATLKGGAP